MNCFIYSLAIILAFLSQCNSVSDFSVESLLTQFLPRSSPIINTPFSGTKHKACKVKGKTGVCMFSWECVNAGGTPMGVCREGFSFGSCCTDPSLVSPLTKVKISPTGVLEPVSYGTHQCGTRSNIFNRKGHIYNGADAEFGEFPWMAALRRVSVLDKTLAWCGGALLNTEWILTAAHCFHKVHPANIIARLGELDLKNPNKKFPFVERRIGKRVVHPQYVAASISVFDICLVKMEKPIRFQPHISPVCLPTYDKIITEGDAFVTGWGKMETSKTASVLQKLKVPVLTNKKCHAMMLSEGYITKLTNKLFCAGFQIGEQDSCQGDSGGPLQKQAEDGRFFVMGIVSTGIGCGKPNFPGIYLRVAPFVTWILETMSR